MRIEKQVENYFSDGYSDSEDFSIDPNTGVIRTTTILDHEKKAYYTLGVSVRDRGNPPLETVQDYRVQILDANDQRRTPTRSKFSFKVSIFFSIIIIVIQLECPG